MPQKTYLDEHGNPIKGTGAYLDDAGNVAGPTISAPKKQYTGFIDSPEDLHAATNFLAGGVAGGQAMNVLGQGAKAVSGEVLAVLRGLRKLGASPEVIEHVVEAIPMAKNLRAGLRVAKSVRDAAKAATVEVPAAEVPALATPAPPVERMPAPVTATPAPKGAGSVTTEGQPLSKVWVAMNKLGVRLPGKEMTRATLRVRQGENAEDVVRSILAEGQAPAPLDPAVELQQRLGTPTDTEAAARLGKMARSGRKTLMAKYGDTY